MGSLWRRDADDGYDRDRSERRRYEDGDRRSYFDDQHEQRREYGRSNREEEIDRYRRADDEARLERGRSDDPSRARSRSRSPAPAPPPAPDAPSLLGGRALPLSVEALLQRRTDEQERAARPVFLTKAQRAELAIRRRQADADATRTRAADTRALAPSDAGAARHGDGSGGDNRRGGSDRRGDRRDDRRDDRRGGGRPSVDPEARDRAELASAIRQRYLGEADPLRKKKVAAKAADRFRFKFDWDADEDTTRVADARFADLGESAPLFGRGFRAGVDRREQRRVAAQAEARLLEERWKRTGGEPGRDGGRRERDGPLARGARRGDEGEGASGREEAEDDGTRGRDRPRGGGVAPPPSAAAGHGRGPSPPPLPGREALGPVAKAALMDARDAARELRGRAAVLHWSEKALGEMTERDWRIFREDFSISFKGTRAQNPLRSWDEAGLPDFLARAVRAAGYAEPSPIQRAAIPLGLASRDVIGIAETGSGKTAAFVLPMLSFVSRQPPMAGQPDIEAEGPYAVVLAPTRELAQQIEEETRKMMRFSAFRVVGVVGGQSIEDQGVALRKGCEVVVATPGRLLDAVERRYAVLNQCSYVVLDEADRMIDMGFEPQVRAVLDAMPAAGEEREDEGAEEGGEEAGRAAAPAPRGPLPPSAPAPPLPPGDGAGAPPLPPGDGPAAPPLPPGDGPPAPPPPPAGAAPRPRARRSTTMFSATMPPAVERLAKTYMRSPVVVTIGSAGRATDNVTQRVTVVKEGEKAGILEREVRAAIAAAGRAGARRPGGDGGAPGEAGPPPARVIVFVNTKRSADSVGRLVDSMGFRSTLLHGGKAQDAREESIKGFREGRFDVLVATDVAGRGIDVPDVALVVNYDMPQSIEAYTHRIGRTGRAGKKGVALTLLTLKDQEVFYDLKKFLEDSNAPVPAQLAHHEAARQPPGERRRESVQYAKR